MATLSIREYEHIAHVANGTVPVGIEPAIATQTVAIGGSSVPSAAFNVRTKFVRLATDTACSFDFGVNPTAPAGRQDLAAGQTEYFGVTADGTLKVAVRTP